MARGVTLADYHLEIDDTRCGMCRKPIIVIEGKPRHYFGLCYDCEDRALRLRYKQGTIPGARKRKKRR